MATQTTIQFGELPELLTTRFGNVEKNAEVAFKNIGSFVDREVQLTFSRIAATGTQDQVAYNDTVWKGYSPYTLHPKNKGGLGLGFVFDEWRVRYGSNGSKGRYSAASKMNQKSGSYRRSWRIQKVNQYGMSYGSFYELTPYLIKDRPVINYNDNMRDNFLVLWSSFVRKCVEGES